MLKFSRILVILILCPLLMHAFAAQPAAAAAAQIYWGAILSGAQYGLPEPPGDMRAVDVFESHAGKRASLLETGTTWYRNGVPARFPTQLMETIRLHGSIPLFSWASRDSALSATDQPAFRNSVVAGGAYDAYIRQFATDAKNWGHPFFLRFDWEMNGWWFPWGEGKSSASPTIVNGNNPGDYARMWRHVHDIFTEVGATNVTWVWCVNEMSKSSSGTQPALSQIYPGSSYVDWTGMDAYNRYGGWDTFNTTLTGAGTTWLLNTYQETLLVAPGKPIMLAEFGSKEDPSDTQRKAAWLTDALLTQIPVTFPMLKAIVYFNRNMSTDPTRPDYSIAIESSSQAQSAFARGIQSSYYATNTFADLPLGKIQPVAAAAPPTNLLANGTFEGTDPTWPSPWSLSVKAGASGSIARDNGTFAGGASSARVTTTQTGGVWWYASLWQGNLAFTAGKTYTITFWAKASSARTIHVTMQQNYSPWSAYRDQVVAIGQGWAKYTLTFIPVASDSNVRLSFSAADATGDLWIDEVTIPVP